MKHIDAEKRKKKSTVAHKLQYTCDYMRNILLMLGIKSNCIYFHLYKYQIEDANTVVFIQQSILSFEGKRGLAKTSLIRDNHNRTRILGWIHGQNKLSSISCWYPNSAPRSQARDVMVSTAMVRRNEDDENRTNSREWATVCAHRNLRPARIGYQTDCNQTTLRL